MFNSFGHPLQVWKHQRNICKDNEKRVKEWEKSWGKKNGLIRMHLQCRCGCMSDWIAFEWRTKSEITYIDKLKKRAEKHIAQQ